MAFQPSVAEYFNSRKRPAVEDLKKPNPTKVLVLDDSIVEIQKSLKIDSNCSAIPKKIVYTNNVNILAHKKPKSTSKSGGLTRGKKGLKSDGSQMDIRTTLFKAANKKTEEAKHNVQAEEFTNSTKDEPISSTRADPGQSDDFSVSSPISPTETLSESGTNKELVEVEPETSSSQVEEKSTSSSRKELNLGNIRAMMSRSSRLKEMKAALKRFNENKAKLDEEQAEERGTAEKETPSLHLHSSPIRTPKKAGHAPSPQGKMTPSRLFDTPPQALPPSPLKSPLKSPAFQRYQALVTEGKPALVLPFKYRALAEVFRCVDTVASMLHNRKETVTITKLRPGVQETSRKNLTEYHLGQIKTVFPNAFEFKLEKMRSFGSAEKYELVMTPILPEAKNDEGDGHVMMGPSVLLSRRRTLYNALLELTKDHHEEFLKSQEPPMCIPRSRLTRWHPGFAVDDVPDVFSTALPQPPSTDKVSTAKDVLERARNLFVVNPRMERALQRVSENRAVPTLSPPSAPLTLTPSTKSALHGVPASLLERVRAKQAARALEAMTRTPAQAKEAVRLSRLPEMARIVRNLFVAEKKSVLTREVVLLKLADSYRESLSQAELDDHLKLLAEKTPGWLTFCHLRKTDYVKLSRSADMSRVMTRLEALATEICV